VLGSSVELRLAESLEDILLIDWQGVADTMSGVNSKAQMEEY